MNGCRGLLKERPDSGDFFNLSCDAGSKYTFNPGTKTFGWIVRNCKRGGMRGKKKLVTSSVISSHPPYGSDGDRIG